MDREAYRHCICQMWVAVAMLEPLPLLNIEIAAKRWGTADELQAAKVLCRAMLDMPKAPKQP